MQLLIIAMMLCLFAHDQAPTLIWAGLSWPTLLVWVLVPKLLVVSAYALVCRSTHRQLISPDAAKRLRRLEWIGGAYRLAGLVLFALDLHVGLLVSVRSGIATLTGIQHPVLIDEVLVMLPTLVFWGLGWWAYYPIDRRLREASMMKRFDQGLPVYPMWTRWQYVWSQYRYQVALILVPLLCIFAWSESVRLAELYGWFGITIQTEPWWLLSGSITIFLLAPLMIRLIWDTVPLPDGEVRRHLLAMCKTHRVRVRELLLWRTYGGMINAAVMGLVGPLRFILITDALLQQMPQPHVEAVMAHELAHVKKRHMVSLIVTAIALLIVVEAGAMVVLASHGIRFEESGESLVMMTDGVDSTSAVTGNWMIPGVDASQALVFAVLAVSGALWVVGFGWVSRRAERQADSFAVAHLARERGGDTVQPGDAGTMIGALQHVADLNHLRVDKHSWRHGSIQWRQDYLKSLAGLPIARLPIDRQMRWINTLSVAAVVAVFVLQSWFN
jgi:STE24 endopeptidase